jgi:hypothetical protein
LLPSQYHAAGASSEWGLAFLKELGFPSPRSPVSTTEKAGEGYNPEALEQSLAADGAIAFLSSSLVPSARMLIARRS